VKNIFVNGTFDILHRGHIELLQYAKSLGTVMVAIDSDRRVRELKGNTRPVNLVDDRKFQLESLRYVDVVCVFDSDQELVDLIKHWQVDIMIKGSDYRDKLVIGAEYCKEIKFYDRTEHSTTEIIERIANRR
jgi:rfaE bifunctional protein nucleotidyltransferase chain/domain